MATFLSYVSTLFFFLNFVNTYFQALGWVRPPNAHFLVLRLCKMPKAIKLNIRPEPP